MPIEGPQRLSSTIEEWCSQGCRSLLSIGWDNLQFYPNFALFSTLGGINLDHDFVQVSKLSEDPKKRRSSPKIERFFPRILVVTYTQMHTRVKLLGDADVDHTQTIGGDTVKLLGGYIPIPPRFRHPWVQLASTYMGHEQGKKVNAGLQRKI